MEYSAAQPTDQTEATLEVGERCARLVGSQAMATERLGEPRILLNSRGQRFVYETLGIACDSPLTNAEIHTLAEKIEHMFAEAPGSDTVPQASLIIQLAVVGQTSAEISQFTGVSAATAGKYVRRICSIIGSVVPIAELAVTDTQIEQQDLLVIEDEPGHVLQPEMLEAVDAVEDEPAVSVESLQDLHAAASGALRGAIYRALKTLGIRNIGILDDQRLAELLTTGFSEGNVPAEVGQAYRRYLQTNKQPYIDNPARRLITEMPALIAGIIARELTTAPSPLVATPEPVPQAVALVAVQAPVRPRTSRPRRAVESRQPNATQPRAELQGVAMREQLPLDTVVMNRLRGSVYRALRTLGVASLPPLEHAQLYSYIGGVMSEQLVDPVTQVAYDAYLRTSHYIHSDEEPGRTIGAMPEWIARKIVDEHAIELGEAVHPEVLIGQRELHTIERHRKIEATAETLGSLRGTLKGTDWEWRQALLSVGGNMQWLQVFKDWCAGTAPAELADTYDFEEATVCRQLLLMARAAGRDVPAAVSAAPASDWVADALCAQTDPELFFPEKGGSTQDAKGICGKCEVQAQCREDTDHHKEKFGFRFGRSIRNRTSRPSTRATSAS